jgi:hypothetical protein
MDRHLIGFYVGRFRDFSFLISFHIPGLQRRYPFTDILEIPRRFHRFRWRIADTFVRIVIQK